MKPVLRLLTQYILLMIFFSFIMFLLVDWLPGAAFIRQAERDRAAQEKVTWFFLDRSFLPGQYCPSNGAPQTCQFDGGQFVDFYSRIFSGHWGNSWMVFAGQPVASLFSQRLPFSIALLGAATVVIALAALPAGFYSGLQAHNHTLTRIFILIRSIPIYWLGLLLFMFGLILENPLAGAVPTQPPTLKLLFLPAILVTIFIAPRWYQAAYQSTATAIENDQVQAALSRERNHHQAIFKHVLPAALIEFTPVFVRQFPIPMFGATIFAETIFGWPGLGSLFISVLKMSDWPIVQALIFPPAAAFLSAFLLSDLLGIVLHHSKPAK